MQLEHVNCDLCGTSEYVERYRKPDNSLWLNQYSFPVVECRSCGLVYVNPRPTFAEIAVFYPSGYHGERDTPLQKARYERQFEYIKNTPGRSILDVGCAMGDWLIHVQGRWPGTELHGVDAFSPGVKSDAIHYHHCTLPEAELPEDHFDIVTSWAVLEHVHNPMNYFSAISRTLKKGGRFVFLVTNSESLYGRRSYLEDIPRHLYHFSESTLTHYAEKVGLQLVKIDYDDQLWDGRGLGTFRYGLGELFGFSWEKARAKELKFATRMAMRAGRAIDNIVFSTHWEQKLRRSGIIITTMTK